jgi:HNH endonuclease
VRRVHRRELPLPTRLELARRLALLNSGEDNVRALWNSFRASAASDPLVSTLKGMAGVRERCMYCSDSRSADVEHYVPISLDASSAFTWSNMLWVCPACNRRKTSQFPVSTLGAPLLIDPSVADPYRFLTLDPDTGNLAPRFSDGQPIAEGRETLRVLNDINIESVAEGRRRFGARLRAAAHSVVVSGGTEQAIHFKQTVREDEWGVSQWFAFWEGRLTEPFPAMRSQRRLWNLFLRMAISNEYGVRS